MNSTRSSLALACVVLALACGGKLIPTLSKDCGATEQGFTDCGDGGTEAQPVQVCTWNTCERPDATAESDGGNLGCNGIGCGSNVPGGAPVGGHGLM